MNKDEARQLVELVLGAFPSYATTEAKVLAYFTILEDFALEECVDAFRKISRKGGQYPASANEIYQEALEARKQHKRSDETQKILERRKMFQREEISEEEAERRKRVFREQVTSKLGYH